ncbi:hypothetical protein PCIT_b0687 [Pseudoalteromonas citrea]|uniref:Protein kinase domain-containing protein n=2 Tax=Pseudoalteromonas citrea TaxID=43655 RepID=A0AAD4AEU0_9GAMM|nr:leucine-rich repeat-containing protein kinase family protein [Pseudoalteromonas citrea]KAF7764645.1 hypothetical protein PCIT_b0687 [Pseudoalteromonas citrea]
MHPQRYTLQQLKNSEVGPVKRLQMVEQLTEFPQEILALKDSLEVLDLSNNKLSSLPDEFDQLEKLKIIFLSNNCFTELPKVLGCCKSLEMIGFKSNQITTVRPQSLPLTTRWLILTDNHIEELPERMGALTQLKKLALAGNRLKKLPDSMANCTELELIRLSANNLNTLPKWLFNLPRLAWLAFSGNPVCGARSNALNEFAKVKLADYELGDKLGEGASGEIFLANQPQDDQGFVAVKRFKGAITSDGYPQDELDCCLNAGAHANLVKTIAQINDTSSLGIVMELIPPTYRNLGLPPSLITCTRDTFPGNTHHGVEHIHLLAVQMASVLAHLHAHNVSHGDIYAHNSLINEHYHLLFGDFGAASQLHHLDSYQRDAMESIEVRAFGYFIEDLLTVSGTSNAEQLTLQHRLEALIKACTLEPISARPKFTDIIGLLNKD